MKNSEIQNQFASIQKLILSNDFANDEILDFKDACNFLKISPSYMYKLTHRRLIVAFKPGGKKLYFSKRELIKWIKSSRTLTQSEIKEHANGYIENKRKAIL